MAKRVTLFFESTKFGWSETFWTEIVTWDTLQSAINELWRKRLVLCGVGIRLSYIRTSDDLISGDALIDAAGVSVVAAEGTQVLPDDRLQNDLTVEAVLRERADRPYSALLVRGQSSINNRRQIWLRGIPDTLQDYRAGTNRFLEWDLAFDAFANVLITGFWGFMGIDKGIMNPEKTIDRLEQTPEGLILTSAAHGVGGGETIRIRGFTKQFKPWNGRFRVRRIDADKLQVYGALPLPEVLFGAQFRPQRQVFQRFTSIQFRGPRLKKTGRPFDSPHGRTKRR